MDRREYMKRYYQENRERLDALSEKRKRESKEFRAKRADYMRAYRARKKTTDN